MHMHSLPGVLLEHTITQTPFQCGPFQGVPLLIPVITGSLGLLEKEVCQLTSFEVKYR